jgi:hypothetical protein
MPPSLRPRIRTPPGPRPPHARGKQPSAQTAAPALPRRSQPADAPRDGIARPEPCPDQYHWSRPQRSRYQHGFSTRSGNDGKQPARFG